MIYKWDFDKTYLDKTAVAAVNCLRREKDTRSKMFRVSM